jgi:DNA polymerase III delta prime subunit
MAEAKERELQYHERLNIGVLSIARIKKQLKSDIIETLTAWEKGRKVQKQCWRIIGPAGVGKTEICYQIAAELTKETGKKFDIIMVKAPVLSRDDFIIPFPVTAGNEPKFKMLYSDFVPTISSSYGIFVIDEFSRGDHTLQQLLWQVQNEYAVHRFKFPEGWFVISIDNPDESQYSMEILEDAAGIRRQLQIAVEVSAIDFLEYAIENKFHPYVIEFIQTHPERVYDFSSQKSGMVYSNPASWEKLSDHLWKMQLTHDGINFDEFEPRAQGLLNVHMTRLFIEFAKEKRDINPKDIFYKFGAVKSQIVKLIKENNNSKLGEIMISFCTYLTTSLPKYEKEQLNNILDFLLLMPIDTGALFISHVDQYERNSKQFQYMTAIHQYLLKSAPKYKAEFYDPIVQCGEGKIR